MKRDDCWVIVSAYNETRHIADVVRRIRKQRYRNVIVVDDGSDDDTSPLAKAAGAVVLRHVVNLGKGASMKTGADEAVDRGAKAIIFVDGDGQHNPEELDLFLDALSGGNDIVFGTRKVRRKMPIERRFGRWLFQQEIRLIYNFDLQDPLIGYRALTREAYRRVRWKSRRYGVEVEMIARAGKEVLEYAEVPVSTVYHDRHKGMTVFDGIKIIIFLVWWRMTH